MLTNFHMSSFTHDPLLTLWCLMLSGDARGARTMKYGVREELRQHLCAHQSAFRQWRETGSLV